MTTHDEPLHDARQAFSAAAELTSAMAAHLAREVSDRGTLDEAKLDTRQSDAYQLSVMLSRLQAARRARLRALTAASWG